MNMLLKPENLSIFYKNKTILENISFSLYEKEILALVGKSGVGKTLLSRAILGLLPKDVTISGNIFYKERLLDNHWQNRLRGNEILYIPQSISFLDPLMKVGLQACGKYDKKVYEKVKQNFELLGLEQKVLNMYPHELSGGMARRVLIATTLVSNPNLIIADEATSSLDLENAINLLNIFQKLKDEGKSIIFITHDINLAAKTADKIIILNDKKIAEEVNAASFLDGKKLKSEYSKALFDTLPKNNFTRSKYLDIKTKDEIAVNS